MKPLRLLLILIAWLLVVLPADALAFIPRHTFTLPAMPEDSALRAESAPSLTLRLDGVYERGQVRYGFLVSQNPWSKFDPHGLTGWGFGTPNEVIAGRAMAQSIHQTAQESKAAYSALRADGSSAIGAGYAAGGHFVGSMIGARGVHDAISGDTVTQSCHGGLGTQQLTTGERWVSGVTGGIGITGFSLGMAGPVMRVAGLGGSGASIESTALQNVVRTEGEVAAAAGPIQVTESSIAKALEGSTMQTVQGEVSLPAVQRYVRMLEEGKVAPAIAVDGKVIVEGNHRYVAGRVFGTEPALTPGTLSPSQLPKVKSIQQTIVDPTDWGNH